MLWLPMTILALLVLMGLLGLTMVLPLRRYGRQRGSAQPAPSPALPPTSVVIPCKGDDGTLLENLESLVQQDHPDIEFVLVTATADDPACAAFTQLKMRQPQRRIRTVVAGIPTCCSQQNNNQVQGVAAADKRSQVLVIMDSDGQADRRFIANLIAPLSDPSVGAASGYRWYEPRWGSLADLLRTAWNAGGFVFLINPQTSFVWGGAMALRRSTYEQAGIASIWSKALSDDMTLSHQLKSMGLKLQFVPECIVVSRAPDTLVSAVRWTNRQTLVTRFYNMPFWMTAGIFHGLGNLLGWGMLLVGLAALLAGRGGLAGLVALAGGAAWLAHLWLFAALMAGPLDELLRPRGVALGARRWVLILVAPLASILQGINSINSCLTRDIHWAGITYRIENHERMQVV